MNRLSRAFGLAVLLLAQVLVGCGKKATNSSTPSGDPNPANSGGPGGGSGEARGQLPPRDPAKDAAAAKQREAQTKQYAQAEATLADAIRKRKPGGATKDGVVGVLSLSGKDGLYAQSAVLSPDGSKVAVALMDLKQSGSKERVYYIKDLLSDLEVCRFKAGFSMSMAFSPDGSLFALAVEKQAVTLWDTATGQQKQSIPIAQIPWGTVFTPDGSGVIVCLQGTPTLFDVITGKQVRTYGKSDFWTPTLSPDGSLLATSISRSKDYGVALWNAATGDLITELKPKGAFTNPTKLQFSPDGATLRYQPTTSDAKFSSWDLKSDAPKDYVKAEKASTFSLSPDGRLAFAQSSSPDMIQVIDVATGAQKTTKSFAAGIGSLSFFPGGTLLGTFENANFTVWDLSVLHPNAK